MGDKTIFTNIKFSHIKPTLSPGPFPNLTEGPGDEVDTKLYVAKISSYQIGLQRMDSCFIRN